MKMKDLNKLSKEIYETNKERGFHEVKHSEEHMLCLVISELMEAVEADRKGKRASVELFNAFDTELEYEQEEHKKRWERASHDTFSFQSCIKDSVEDELADVVIRLLDTAGALGLALYSFSKGSFGYGDLKEEFEHGLFTENILIIIRRMLNSTLSISLVLSYTVFYIEILCEVMDIDLWKHVELKLKYNSLRPYKHGKNIR